VNGFAAAALASASLALFGASGMVGPIEGATVYAVRINGIQVSDGSVVVRDANGDLLVRGDDLHSWRITPHDAGTKIEGLQYFRLTALPGLRYAISAADVTLDLTVPPALFDRTVIDLTATSPPHPPPAHGALLKYEAFLERTPASAFNFSGFADVGGFRGDEAFGSTFIAGAPSGRQRFVRLETQWRRDFGNAVLHIGDSTRVGSTMFPPERFAGVEWATDFTLNPYLVTYPVPTIEGIATTPTVLDVLINGEQTASVTVPAGPYDISGLSLPSGEGAVQFATRDLSGRILAAVAPFYSGIGLLKHGLTTNSIAVGVDRQRFGESSFSYGSNVAAYTRRIGISDRSTVEADAGYASGALSGAIADDVLLDNYGVLTSGIGVSSNERSGGVELVMGFAHADRSFGIAAREQLATAGFAAPGSPPSKSLVRSGLIALSFDAGRIGALQMVYTLQTNAAGARTAMVVGALNGKLRAATVRLAYIRTVAPVTENGASLSVAVPLGPGGTLNIGGVAQRFGGGATMETVQDLPAGGPGMGYAISAGKVGGVENDEARIAAANDALTFSVDASRTGKNVTVSAGASGVIGVIDGRPFSSRQIGSQSFGIVDLGGFGNVRVFVNNSYAGRTGSNGRLTVTLLPYQANDVRFEPTDLPISATIGDVHRIVSTRAGGGAAIEFDVRAASAASATIVDAAGTPLLAGSVVTSDVATFVVGTGGEVYLTDLRRGKQIFHSEAAGKICSFVVDIEQAPAAGTNLGTFACR
jgi:outer membrane usher protein